MLTVVINTNSNASDCESLFGELNFLATEEAIKKVIVLSCPLSSWFSDGGYKELVKVLTDRIDNDSELDNALNVIVFVNLSQWKSYLYSKPDELDLDRVALYDMLVAVLTHVVSHTLRERLVEVERLPEDGKIGLLVEDCRGSKRMISQYQNADVEGGFVLKQAQALANLTGIACGNITADDSFETVLDRACLYSLFRHFENNVEATSVGRVLDNRNTLLNDKVSLFEFDAENAQHDRRMWLKRCYTLQKFVYNCLANGLPDSCELPNIDLDTLTVRLKEKKALFSMLLNRIDNFENSTETSSDSVTIQHPSNALFGLDETGSIYKHLEEATGEEAPQMLDDSTSETSGASTTVVSKPNECWVDEETMITLMDEYKPDQKPKEAGDYCKTALELAEYHLKLLRILDVQVNDALHGYSYSPNETTQPRLGGRLQAQKHYSLSQDYDKSDSNSISSEDSPDDDLKNKKRDKELDSAKRIADRGYRSLLSEYVEENNNQSIESTSIIKQTDTFVKRIRELEAAMNRILAISAGFCGGLLVLTAFPFLMIQLKSLLTNPGGIPIAIGFILAPVLLYFLCILFIKAIYKKRMRELWEQLVEEHERIMNHNEQSVERFNDVIGRYIPALRYYYGYFMDLRFFERYKRIRDAKVLHHKRKLAECLTRVTEVLNLIDSGFGSKRIESSGFDEVKIDFNQSFYGEHNRKIYSLFDSVNNENA